MFRNVTRNLLLSSTLLITACGGGGSSTTGGGTTTAATIEEVGQLLFEDVRLSNQGNQSCATCHDSTHGFADPSVSVTAPVSEGSIAGRFGDRNAPTAAYAKFTPAFSQNCSDTNFNNVPCGGQFLDGRRDSLADQARDPFLNPVEMANANEAEVVQKVQNGPYADKFKAVFGSTVFNNTATAYDKIVEAIAAYERTTEFSPFDSKFDCYRLDPARYPLSTIEQEGLDLFTNQANCSVCHTIPATGPVLFTNHMYFNIGVPKNPDHPLGTGFVDHGLMNHTGDSAHDGLFKTPTLRNVELTAPYMHNGVFATLEDVVAFYLVDLKLGEPDVDPTRAGNQPPEVDANISPEVEGRGFVALDPDNITRLVAFMKTLTDGSGKGICF